MFNKQLKANIETIDKQISTLMEGLNSITDDNEFEMQMRKIEDLTKVRKDLMESKGKNSSRDVIISGVFGLTSVLLVLHYEKANVVTSKAYNVATRMFRGS